VMLKFLAGVQSAAAPKPCPCRTLGPSDWITKRNLWGYNIATGPDSGRTVYACPGELCPKCHKPLPPKPPEAMTIEECAEAFAKCRYAPSCWWDKIGSWCIEYGGNTKWVFGYDTCLAAWQAAVRKLREGGSR